MVSTQCTEKTRLYVQLRPDVETLGLLQNTRTTLADGRPVPDNELHMTVIHIGELSRLIAILPEIDPEKILRAAELFVDELKIIATPYSSMHFKLRASGIEAFGKTIAVTYEPSQELKELHHQALVALENMLRSIGIDKPRTFMENNTNLRYAVTLRPHVALVKNTSSPTEPIVEHDGSYSLMKIVY